MPHIDLLERLNAIVWEADAATLRFSFVTRMVEELLGFAVDDWLSDGDFLARRLHPDDREAMLEVCRGVAADAADRQCDHRMVAADGGVRWFRTVVHGLRDGDGPVGELLGLMVDITAQKHSEAAMQAAEERVLTVVNNAPILLFACDRAGIITLWEGRGMVLLDSFPTEMEGRSAFEVYARDPEVAAHLERALAGATFTSVDALRFASSWFETRWSPLIGPDGTIEGTTAVATDITARKRAEEERAWLLDASRVLASSFEFEENLAAVARRALGLFAERVTIDVLEPDGTVKRVADVGAHSDEQTMRMAVPMEARGQPLGTLTFYAPRAQRRYGEAELELAHDLAGRAALAIENARLYRDAKEAVRLRDEFLSVASHELRTPITSLQLAVQGLLEFGLGAPEEFLQNALRSAERQSRRLGRLVDALLDVSRIGSGRIALELSEVDLSKVARDVAASMAKECERARSPLALSAEQPVIGRWDRGRLEQVITNLVSNACKYGAGKPIEVGVGARDGRAVLSVRDHGIGVAPREQARIFERFERAVPERHYGGLGLGLYIVRSILQAHGGTIRVESELGQGATFVAELPL